MRAQQVLAVLGMLSLWQPAGAGSQEQERLEGYYNNTGMYRLEGKAAPRSVAVKSFFDQMLLDYVESGRRDRYGNQLRWASRVQFESVRRLAAVDVLFLVRR